MKLLSTVFRWLKAKDAAESEAIENANATAFAAQDLEQLEKDRDNARDAVAGIKAEVAGLERDVAAKKAAIAAKTDDAHALIKAGKEDLARQVCALIEDLEKEVGVLDNALTQQKGLCEQQERQYQQLNQAVSDARRSLRMMKTMEAVASSTEKAASVRIGDGSSALARFKQRESTVRRRLDKAQAASQLGAPADQKLEEQVQAALGTGKGDAVLARLKAQEPKLLPR